MQLVLLKGFGTALTGTSRTLDFSNTCSDRSDGFSGLDFLTGLDGFSGFSGLVLVLLSDWIGLVFLDFQDSGLLLRLVFQDLVSVWFFQRFGTVGCFKDWTIRYFKDLVGFQRIKEKMKLTDIGLWKFDGYWIRTFWFRDIGFDCFVSINFCNKIKLYTYPQQ